MSTALVTGGSAGIGREIVKRLLTRGDEVISLDVKPTDFPGPDIGLGIKDNKDISNPFGQTKP